jgi:DNA-binding NtrC family response regulator
VERIQATNGLELVVFAGDQITRHPLPSSGRRTVGRDPASDIHIDDGSVSRHHAVLDLGPPIRIVDLGSANGSRVRRRDEPADSVDTHELRRRPGETFEVAVGDRVGMGSVTAVIRHTAERRGALTARAPAMAALHEQARRAAQGTIGILLLGETGVGKEVLAREIHALSPRVAGPFVAVHCAALSESLIEGELFGHEKGAFTGAAQARPGLFEAADGGTVLLDEIGEVSLAVQVKLLRVLEERAVLRVGARAPRSIDVRFLAATNRDLEAEVARGTFRQDLYYRLGGIALTIPPLRARRSEIAPLARLFLEEARRKMDSSRPRDIDAGALATLERYAWPGNVRELRHAMERAAVLSDGDVVLPEHLSTRIAGGAEVTEASAPPPPEPAPPTLKLGSLAELDAAREALERKGLVEALERCGGNQTRAAAMLGISRRTLVGRLKDFGLPRPRKRE